MNIIKYIPIIGGWLEKILAAATQKRNREAEMAQEVELEMIKRGKGRPTPRMMMGYIAAFAMLVVILWEIAAAVWEEFPIPPFDLTDIGALFAMLFGFGG